MCTGSGIFSLSKTVLPLLALYNSAPSFLLRDLLSSLMHLLFHLPVPLADAPASPDIPPAEGKAGAERATGAYIYSN